MDLKQMQVALARLQAIKSATISVTSVDVEIVRDFHRILDLAAAAGATGIEAYKVPSSSASNPPGLSPRYSRAVFASKLEQALAHLKSFEPDSQDNEVVRIGTLFTAIADDELRSR